MKQLATIAIPIQSLHNEERKSILVKWHIVLYGSLLKILFDLSFALALQIQWETAFPLEATFSRIVFSSLSIVIMLLALPVKRDAANYFAAIILFVIVIPMSTIFAFQSRNSLYYVLVCLSFLCVELVLDKIAVLSSSNRNNLGKWIRYAFFVITIITVIWLYLELGRPTLIALDWKSVYELRASYELPSHLSRLSRITAMTVIPVLFADSLLARRYWISFATCLAQFLIYLWLGHKIYLFMIPVVFFSTKLSKMDKKGHLILITLKVMLAVVSILTVAEILWHGNSSNIGSLVSLGYSLVMRRTFFVPAQLRFDYYDFFVTVDNPTVGLLGSAISPLLLRLGYSNPYADSSYSQAVGTWLGTGANANTGIFGGEIAHFGVWGIPVAAMCLLILLLCIRISNRRNGYAFTLGSSLFPMLYLMNGNMTDIFSFSPLAMLVIVLLLYQPMSKAQSKQVKLRFSM